MSAAIEAIGLSDAACPGRINGATALAHSPNAIAARSSLFVIFNLLGELGQLENQIRTTPFGDVGNGLAFNPQLPIERAAVP